MLTERRAITLQLLLELESLLERILILLDRIRVDVELIQIVVLTFQVEQIRTAAARAYTTTTIVHVGGRIILTYCIVSAIIVNTAESGRHCRITGVR